MPNDATANEASSGETSRRAVNEAAFLSQQSAAAADAIADTLAEIKGDLKANLEQATDLRQWVDRYPWATLAAASATGFVAALVLTPGKGERAVDKWSRMAERFTGSNGSVEKNGEENGAAHPRPAEPPTASIWAPLLVPLIEMAGVALQQFLTTAMSRTASPPPEESPATETPAVEPMPDAPDAAML
jgi:hypothetical protein